ncbi:MAG: hypothetical protein OXE73_00080 [Gammaproteobacteria bacterium]|nr:hypothetical protein [Gammaproteobacteria bacterium]
MGSFARTICHIAFTGILGIPALLHAQQSPNGPPTNGQPPNARAAAVAAPPVIDGRLDDALWSGLEPLDGFIQREPSEGQAVSQPTEVRVGYDDAALYIGAWLSGATASSRCGRPCPASSTCTGSRSPERSRWRPPPGER